MYIKSLEREIILLPHTRKVSRLMEEAMYKGVVVDASFKVDGIPFQNIKDSESVMIKSRTLLTEDELDTMTIAEYELLLDECNKTEKAPLVSSSKKSKTQ